jgi:hypothetical protein
MPGGTDADQLLRLTEVLSVDGGLSLLGCVAMALALHRLRLRRGVPATSNDHR